MKGKKLKLILEPVNTSPASNLKLILKDRAQMLASARAFFTARDITEVDCPALTQKAPVDEHIDVMSVSLFSGEKRYLHTSPEYGMKRLLSAGSGDIYQLSHVFREGEYGPFHNPEFTMAEWYRLNIPFDHFIDETIDFIRLFLGDLKIERQSYRELLKSHTGIDYLYAKKEDLLDYLKTHQVGLSAEWNFDSLLQLILNRFIEPSLGENSLFVLTDFPASQAALARIKGEIAERFEIYHQGIELANGYHELADSEEQRKRFISSNEKRIQNGKNPLPIDDYLLDALSQGFPDCCGVAVGFDRLLMLKHLENNVAAVLPFPWDIA